MKWFVIKLTCYLAPFLILLLIYIYNDPFKIIYRYDSYLLNGGANPITLNKGYYGLMNYLDKSDSVGYNSFILGNSRSMFYPIEHWRRFLEPNSKCYHFDASGETLEGLYEKVIFLSKRSGLNNVLMVIDHELISNRSTGQYFNIIPYQLTRKESWWSFHLKHLTSYLDWDFLTAYLHYKSTGRIKDYMTRKRIFSNNRRNYDKITNEESFVELEKEISKGTYHRQHASIFYNRDSVVHNTEPVIEKEQKKYFTEIRKIFGEHNTHYKIVLSPLYDQKKISTTDLQCLTDIFGSQNVFDFSGVNAFTSDIENYYETSHYRPIVARQIMDIIYSPEIGS